MRASKAINVVSTLLVMALAVAAFTLSYSALRDLAAGNGIPVRLAWVWPLVVDGFLLVASLSVLRNSLSGERALYQWSLVGLFTVASVAFNVVHAGRDPLAIAVGATPPVALALALELVMSQVKSDVKRQGVRETLASLTQSVSDKRQKLTELERSIEAKRRDIERLTDQERQKSGVSNVSLGKLNDPDTLKLANLTRSEDAQQAIERLLTFYADNPDAPQSEAADFADRSRSWVSQTLGELEAEGVIKRNGNGVEILANGVRGG
jgi:hypothetical protein